jgi:hypothetical protein
VRDDQGVAVPNTVVTFTTDDTLGTFAPVSGTALTDSSGVATVALNPASLTAAGAAMLTAKSQVGTTGVDASIGYSVGAASVTLTNFTFGTNPLSAFGTTSVSVTVNTNGAPVTSPQTVTFSSPCAGAGKAALTQTVLTGTGGVATASYRDIGCGGDDVVTASVGGLASATSTLTVAAPTTGSIQFVEATPTTITLKGTGGAGKQESSLVVFKVVDTGGNPIGGKTVDFELSTSVGGITFANGLTTSSAVSDATTGYAVVTVNSGTISTPVRVRATTLSGATTLSTQSDQLTITTGIPDQDSFSLSATKLNIEGWDYDGETTVLTARLADHFSNPVPDDTAVNFIAEGGSVTAVCFTHRDAKFALTEFPGQCEAVMTSQELRPTNGRITVLAYAIGEESFIDLDGDGLADHTTLPATDEMIDANGNSTDIGEAFVDFNENGVRDAIGATAALEPYIDFDSNGSFDAVADGAYNGVLCNDSTGTSASGTCGAARSVHVRRNFTIVFSGSHPVFRLSAAGIALPTCTDGALFVPSSQSLSVTITDVNDNIMPVGTTVSFSTTNGAIVSAPQSFVVPNSTACLLGGGPAPGFTCPATSAVPLGTYPLAFPVTVQSDATQDKTTLVCSNSKTSGVLTITVTTPKGVATTLQVPVTD